MEIAKQFAAGVGWSRALSEKQGFSLSLDYPNFNLDFDGFQSNGSSITFGASVNFAY